MLTTLTKEQRMKKSIRNAHSWGRTYSIPAGEHWHGNYGQARPHLAEQNRARARARKQ